MADIAIEFARYLVIGLLLCGGTVLVLALLALARLPTWRPPMEPPDLRLETPGSVRERLHGEDVA